MSPESFYIGVDRLHCEVPSDEVWTDWYRLQVGMVWIQSVEIPAETETERARDLRD